MTRYYVYVAIALIITTLWQYGDTSVIKIKTLLIMMTIIQLYILYELTNQNPKGKK